MLTLHHKSVDKWYAKFAVNIIFDLIYVDKALDNIEYTIRTGALAPRILQKWLAWGIDTWCKTRAVVSLTVPGGQDFYFSHSFLKFQSIFPQTFLIFFILALQVGNLPTWRGPGYATNQGTASTFASL